jgi:hypothetical protein
MSALFPNILFSLPSPPLSNQRSNVLDDNVELRPFLLNKSPKKDDYYYLPPIQHVLTPSSSPSSEELDFTPLRKNSIASLLNTEPTPVIKRGRPRQGIVKRKTNHADFLPRATKGLRHFSKQVCDKVAQKKITTYNEVADELAMDIQKSLGTTNVSFFFYSSFTYYQQKHSYDQKNIRRRVYDALNVLMAMNIITKDKKVIKWLGIPECYKTTSDDLLLKEIRKEQERQVDLMNSLDLLRGVVKDKMSKHVHIRNIIWRNQQQPSTDRIDLPFFIIQCPSQHDIQSNQHSAVVSFISDQQQSQVIIEDTEVLRHLNA